MSHALYSAILEILKKERNLTDSELFEALKERYRDLSLSSFNKTLLKLEINGLVHVSGLSKSGRRVELVSSS
jgi:Fe2+ or Zn2+ uptake regulation protein